jgi:two-component system sensor kinase FixL
MTTLGAPLDRLPRDARLATYVVAGVLLGVAYVAFDMVSESRLEQGTLTGVLAGAHAVVDRSSPIIIGAMLGVFAHYLSLRKKLAEAEEKAARAEALKTRLLKVERDQAVWVLVAAVLHELNNPLHALGLLLDEHATESNDLRRTGLLERARAHADRARDHLAVLRTLRGAAEPDLGPVPLGHIVRTLAADVGSLAERDGVSVFTQCDTDVEARADATYVRTILENLVDNSLCAIRAGGGGNITIRAGAENGYAVVRVADDGLAIDDEAQKNLFEPLRSTKTQGLGLGLPIARALARAMRGNLSLDDAHGKVFRLELPLHVRGDVPGGVPGGAPIDAQSGSLL